MGVPSEKVENAIHSALYDLAYASEHAEPEDVQTIADLQTAERALRCIVAGHNREDCG